MTVGMQKSRLHEVHVSLNAGLSYPAGCRLSYYNAFPGQISHGHEDELIT